jgi:hypothetical protein
METQGRQILEQTLVQAHWILIADGPLLAERPLRLSTTPVWKVLAVLCGPLANFWTRRELRSGYM